MKDTLGLQKGDWVVGNCGKHSSEIDCKMVFLAPEKQKDELIKTIAQHAVHYHNNKDTPELRQMISQALETVKV